MTKVADTYAALKQQEADLKKKLAVASKAVNAALDAGEEVVTSTGIRYIRQVQEKRTYKVTGLGGILALLRNHTELDAATLISVSSAAAQALSPELQAELAFTVTPIQKVVKG
ncbi:MAG: hypothetical protein WC965_01005 [Thiohalomonadaceae bacterium]